MPQPRAAATTCFVSSPRPALAGTASPVQRRQARAKRVFMAIQSLQARCPKGWFRLPPVRQLRREAPLGEGVEEIIFLVGEVFDAESRVPMLADSEIRSCIGH